MDAAVVAAVAGSLDMVELWWPTGASIVTFWRLQRCDGSAAAEGSKFGPEFYAGHALAVMCARAMSSSPSSVPALEEESEPEPIAFARKCTRACAHYVEKARCDFEFEIDVVSVGEGPEGARFFGEGGGEDGCTFLVVSDPRFATNLLRLAESGVETMGWRVQEATMGGVSRAQSAIQPIPNRAHKTRVVFPQENVVDQALAFSASHSIPDGRRARVTRDGLCVSEPREHMNGLFRAASHHT